MTLSEEGFGLLSGLLDMDPDKVAYALFTNGHHTFFLFYSEMGAYLIIVICRVAFHRFECFLIYLLVCIHICYSESLLAKP